MATIDDARKVFSNTNYSIESEEAECFLVSIQDVKFHVLKQEIDDYLKVAKQIVAQPETSVFFPGYYEHLVETQSPIVGPRRFGNDEDLTNINSQDEAMCMDVSPASSCYLLAILQKVDFNIIRRRALMTSMMRERMRAEEAPLNWTEMFRRFLTIKITAKPESSYHSKREKLKQIAEAGLFHISYGNGMGLNLSRSWERTYQRFAQRRRETIQFPRRAYKSDLVSYYQLALSSDSLFLSYLSLYKILEYFFLTAAESALQKRLIEKLVSPDFSHTKSSQLRQLATLIRKYDQKMDEQRMLATVLSQHFEPDEIINWLHDYERASSAYYTQPQTIFGQSLSVDINPENIASSLARRIYHIRNALVHNKEGELPRFIPFSGQETVLSQEMPIILFLAEQLIIKTGDDT